VMASAANNGSMPITGGSGSMPPTGGSGSNPPTSGSGLIRSQSPMDTSGNMLITGNVGGGRFFRGVVPYNSPSDFQGYLGSSALDSFIRDSAGSESFLGYTGRTLPYYSQTRTVTSTSPDQGGIVRPPVAGIGAGISKTEGVILGRSIAREKSISEQDFKMYGIGARPMSMTLSEMQKLISTEVAQYPLGGNRIPTEEEKDKAEQPAKETKKAGEKANKIKEDIFGGEKDIKKTEQAKEKQQEFQMGKVPAGLNKEGPMDVYSQMKQEAAKPKQAAAGKIEPGSDTGKKKNPMEKISEKDRVITEAKQILGEHKTFISMTNDKFNEYMAAGEYYLKEGKYYKAADAYTLASLYKPDNPLAYAGRSHALFIAGEYMSSALFLSRAIEIFPEYAQFKIDIEGMIGSRDKLENRIANVEELLKMTDAPEMQFLLGYICYQVGRIELAKGAIAAACEKMPDSKAAAALKEVIESGK